jgi:hypothetical protein
MFTDCCSILLHDTVDRSIFNNYFMLNKHIGLSSCSALTTVPLKNSFSTVKPQYNPESLALEHINSGNITTSSIINKILLNQNLSVTDAKLEELLEVKGVEIDIPISNPKDKQLLNELTGKSKYKGFFGVYIFIHKKNKSKICRFI